MKYVFAVVVVLALLFCIGGVIELRRHALEVVEVIPEMRIDIKDVAGAIIIMGNSMLERDKIINNIEAKIDSMDKQIKLMIHLSDQQKTINSRGLTNETNAYNLKNN